MHSWREKFTLWFKPTGYRPADVAEKYPVQKIEAVYHFDKYATKTSTPLHAWCWLQLVMILMFIAYLFGQIAYINSLNDYYIYWYGAFTFLSVYALTDLMDRIRSALFIEVLRCGLGLWFLWDQGDWFGASQWLASVKYVLGEYFIVSISLTSLYAIRHLKEDRQPVLSS